MEKIILLFSLLVLGVFAEELQVQDLENKCLECHVRQQIPSELIYRRYLMKYSTKEMIAQAMLAYIKNPKKENSIMPPQFFLKFPMKPSLSSNEDTLRENISTYIDIFDVKKKLVLP